jgi:hypothetical protein
MIGKSFTKRLLDVHLWPAVPTAANKMLLTAISILASSMTSKELTYKYTN